MACNYKMNADMTPMIHESFYNPSVISILILDVVGSINLACKNHCVKESISWNKKRKKIALRFKNHDLMLKC